MQLSKGTDMTKKYGKSHAGDEDLQLPLKFCVHRNGKIYQLCVSDKDCLQDWFDLRSKCKWFVLVAIQAINVICVEVMKMDVKQVVAKRTRSYHAGWGGHHSSQQGYHS